MSARKQRPERGAPVTPDMSLRDVAAALGWSTAKLCLAKRLAELPEDEFEARLDRVISEAAGARRIATEADILRAPGAPVPARGRVERACSLWRRMTAAERDDFLARAFDDAEASA